MTLKTTTLHTIRDIEVGDRVVFPERQARVFSAQARHLEVGRPYVVTGVHPLSGTSGTLTLDGALNPDSPTRWKPGSFGFAIFERVVAEPLADIPTEELLEELRRRGTLEGTFTTTVTINLSEA